jgi:hypothetical protein
MTAIEKPRTVGEALLKKAQDDATTAVEQVTTLRGASARKVAHRALAAGGPALRQEHAIRLGGRPDAVALVAAGALALLDVTIFSMIASGKAPRVTRPFAAVAGVGRIALFAYAQLRQHRVREQIAAGLAEAAGAGAK